MTVLRFLKIIALPFRWWLFGSLMSLIIVAIDIAVRPYLTKLLIDIAITQAGDQALNKLWELAPIYIGMQFLLPTVRRLEDLCELKYGPEMKNYACSLIMQRLAQHSHSFFLSNLSGNIANKVSDIASTAPRLLYVLGSYVQILLGLICALYVLYSVHIWFVISILVWAAFFISVSVFSVKRATKLSRASAEASSDIVGYIVNFFDNIGNIRLFSGATHEFGCLDQVQKQYLLANRKKRWYAIKVSIAQWYSFAIYQSVCLVTLIKLYGQGQVSPGDFSLIFIINIRIIDHLWSLSERLRQTSDDWGVVSQGLQSIWQPIEIADNPAAVELKVDQGSIAFEQVAFHYQGSRGLFYDKSIFIPPQQKVGLVGYSGSGKTSFVNLILRLFDINSGRILIDNQDISMVTQKSLRDNIALVPQEPILFHRSIMDNIRYGNLGATDEQVMEAAKDAQIHDVIMQLPKQYQSVVGDESLTLSGGQKQRIAIARAILKDAKIVILDEATSQLDTVTEALILSSIEKLMRGKTTLVIAHRLSTLKNMNRILVFDQGKIVQDGTHQELLSMDGLYRDLWNSQVGGFLPEKNRNIIV